MNGPATRADGEPYLGAHVAGWAAHVIDVILRRYDKDYVRAMGPQRRREYDIARRGVHAAALHWQSVRPANGSAETPNAEAVSPSSRGSGMSGLTADAAAAQLGLTSRRVRQLAVMWAEEGLARKVRGVWLIDAAAVEMYVARGRGDAA